MNLKLFWYQFIIKKVKPKNLYLDRESKERGTGVCKPKFKLAFNFIKDIDIYPFFILNSERTFSYFFTFSLNREDWHYKCLKEKTSYIDVRNPEIMEGRELYSKINNKRKIFFFKDRLKDEKFEELKNFCQKIRRSSDVSPEKKNLTLIELTGTSELVDDVNNFISKYKI